MAALAARDAFKYGARLFGYLLATTLLGGALVAGGLGAIYTLEPGVLFGSESPSSYAPVAAGGLLAVLGVLVILTGLFLIAFVAVTDAVRVGLDRSAFGPDAPATAGSSAVPEPGADGFEETEPAPAGEPAPTEDTAPAGEPAPGGDPPQNDDPLAGGTADPFESGDPLADSEDDSDPLAGPPEDQHTGAGKPGQNRAAGQSAEPTRNDNGNVADDEAWRREIEAKLEDEDDRRSERPE